MKKLVISITILFILTGCTKDEVTYEKETYLALKEDLITTVEFTGYEDLPCDITLYLNRVNDEELSYLVIIDNPKEDMYNIKAIAIHDYYTEDIFPSIGIFDDSIDLTLDSESNNGITLGGYIESMDDIEILEARIYLEYTNSNGETNIIYYKTTN